MRISGFVLVLHVLSRGSWSNMLARIERLGEHSCREGGPQERALTAGQRRSLG